MTEDYDTTWRWCASSPACRSSIMGGAWDKGLDFHDRGRMGSLYRRAETGLRSIASLKSEHGNGRRFFLLTANTHGPKERCCDR